MSEIPEVFDGFEQKLAQVLSFTVVPLNKQELKKAVEEWLIYISSIVERASKAESRITELEAENAELKEFINQLIEAGDAVINAEPMWIAEEDKWDELVKDWKERKE